MLDIGERANAHELSGCCVLPESGGADDIAGQTPHPNGGTIVNG
nr:hypothetical protein [Burkholderia mayonis]